MSERVVNRVETVEGVRLARLLADVVVGTTIIVCRWGSRGHYGLMVVSEDERRLLREAGIVPDRVGGTRFDTRREAVTAVEAILGRPVRLRHYLPRYRLGRTDCLVARHPTESVWGLYDSLAECDGITRIRVGGVDRWPTRKAAVSAFITLEREGTYAGASDD